MSFLTPLRYPGGKARLGPWLAELMRHNRISGGWYVEAYAGGAGAAFFLLMRGYVNHIVINDADPVIFAFWSSVLHHNRRLLEMIRDIPVNMDTWYSQREILASPDNYDPTEVGFAAFFMNRTNRSGIVSGGVIGGKSQNGPYKIDARYNKDELCERVKRIGDMRKHISAYGMDALDLIEEVRPQLPPKSLIYFDPPYFEKGSQLYRNHYKPEDHAHIANTIQRLNVPWVVTYDNCEPIRSLYSEVPCVEFSLHYSTHMSRPKTTEAMFYSNLELHDIPRMTKKT